ncbi:MAG: hypothetical protein QNJ49_12310 [Mastigocoleus sp. MO_167.B18]|nr:hypothetical protein [Mastigocoleus sp. MO_167.B18]
MATTALIVEIIVVGIFSSIWLLLLVFKCYSLDPFSTLNWLSQYKDWSTFFLVIFLAVCYQLGWLINGLSYFISKRTFNKVIRDKILRCDAINYDLIRTTIFIKGSPFLLGKIREELSVVRLTRTATVNFLLISLMLFIYRSWILGTVVLLIFVFSFIQAYGAYKQYCGRIFSAYKVIEDPTASFIEKE